MVRILFAFNKNRKKSKVLVNS